MRAYKGIKALLFFPRGSVDVLHEPCSGDRGLEDLECMLSGVTLTEKLSVGGD